MRRSVPPTTQHARRPSRGSLASVTSAIARSNGAGVDRHASAPIDALSFVSSLVDLRAAVDVSRVLESVAAPFDDRAPSATAHAAVDRALAAIEAVERAI